jgi:flagellar hook-associated protein 3 FlgL
VPDITQWVPDRYTISFTAPDAWQVTDSSNAVVATGAYTVGGGIAFRGINVGFQGQPVTGDSFTIDPSPNQSLFKSVQDFITSLSTSQDLAVDRSKFQSQLNATLQNLDGALSNVDQVRSEVGARLAAIDEQKTANDDVNQELNQTVSTLQDTDYAGAISRLEQRLASLEAAQKAFARVQSFSLFDVL